MFWRVSRELFNELVYYLVIQFRMELHISSVLLWFTLTRSILIGRTIFSCYIYRPLLPVTCQILAGFYTVRQQADD